MMLRTEVKRRTIHRKTSIRLGVPDLKGLYTWFNKYRLQNSPPECGAIDTDESPESIPPRIPSPRPSPHAECRDDDTPDTGCDGNPSQASRPAHRAPQVSAHEAAEVASADEVLASDGPSPGPMPAALSRPADSMLPPPSSPRPPRPSTSNDAETVKAVGNGHDRTLDAEQRLTPMERLRSFTTASSIYLKADPNAEFGPDVKESIKRFAGFLHGNWIELFQGRRLPEIVLVPVAVSDGCDPPKVSGAYICVKGLRSDEEILLVHLALSQKAVRRHYAPLKLCYDRSHVSFAAEETSPSRVRISGPPRGHQTLCGRMLYTERGGSTWITTIGGLITVGSRHFLMTSTDHSQEPSNSAADELVLGHREDSLSPVDALVDGDFDDDVERAVVLRTVSEVKEHETAPLARPSVDLEAECACPLSCTYDIVGADSDSSHWRLMPAPEDLCLPNYISVPADIFGPTPSSGYIHEYRPSLESSPVVINAGVSGLSAGSLAGNPSYLVSNGRVQEVWTIQLKDGASKLLCSSRTAVSTTAIFYAMT